MIIVNNTDNVSIGGYVNKATLSAMSTLRNAQSVDNADNVDIGNNIGNVKDVNVVDKVADVSNFGNVQNAFNVVNANNAHADNIHNGRIANMVHIVTFDRHVRNAIDVDSANLCLKMACNSYNIW